METVEERCETRKQDAANPVKFLQEVIDHHYRFQGSLRECVNSVEQVVACIEIHDVLAGDNGESEKEFSSLLRRLEAMQRSAKAKELLTELDTISTSIAADEGNIQLLAGLLIGLRFGGMSCKQIAKEVEFLTDHIPSPSSSQRGGRSQR